MKREVYIFVPGILSKGHNTWAQRAVTHVQSKTGSKAERLAYWAGPLTRRFRQGRRVKGLRKMVDFYLRESYTVHLVGHSNGCDIIRRLLIAYSRSAPVSLGRIVMIAAAIPASYHRNGLNAALSGDNGQAYRMPYLYLSQILVLSDPKDRALWWGGMSRKALGWMGLGYGDLGRRGPDELNRQAMQITRHIEQPGIGHSGYFSPDNFGQTMTRILKPTQK